MVDTESILSVVRRQATELARLAREEDLGEADITTSLLDYSRPAAFSLRSREAGVLSGCEVAFNVLAAYDDRLTLDWEPEVIDGMLLPDKPFKLGVLRGPLAPVLAVERPLLNFLQRLSGIATLTRKFVDAVAGTNARIYDTRKTIPGWRVLDKYAVQCGGGRNHRFGLYDAILIKDNHLSGLGTRGLSGAVFELLNQASQMNLKPAFVEVEADDLEQVDELLKVVGIDIILLDNFSLKDMRQAVERRDAAGLQGKVRLEASGGITLDNVRAIAETGVERISVGAITHSAAALDIGLDA